MTNLEPPSKPVNQKVANPPAFPHTPGPWVELGFTGYDLSLGIDIEPRSESSSGPVIARVHVTNRNEHARQQAAANARLVAAAPELLAACKAALDLIDRSRFGDDGVGSTIRAAIRKATGAAAPQPAPLPADFVDTDHDGQEDPERFDGGPL